MAGFIAQEKKALEGGGNGLSYELVKLVDPARGQVILLLSQTGNRGGEFFGNHLWQELSAQRSRLEAVFERIESVDDFYAASSMAMGHEADGNRGID